MKAIRTIAALLFFVTMVTPTSAAHAVATDNSQLLIAQVQIGSDESASQEFISIYNNTLHDVDMTNWCLSYKNSLTKPGCIVSSDGSVRFWLAAHSYTTFASEEFVAAHPDFIPQAASAFHGGLADSGGDLRLLDADGIVQDQFVWTAKPDAGTIFQRLAATADTLQDTDTQSDFVETPLIVPINLGLYEQEIPVDVCPNIAASQPVLPDGYLYDTEGNCQLDRCPNLDGLQSQVPDGYQVDDDGNSCNVEPVENSRLDITELLPNPSSYDNGNEFIELYNPNTKQVKLHGYKLVLQSNPLKTFTFTDGVLSPLSYQAFSDTTVGFLLPNSSGSLQLISPEGETVGQTDTYNNPGDNEAWAMIDGSWQLTNTPTAGASNLATEVESSTSTTASGLSQLLPCPAGKYRNPTTNRCRNLAVASSLQPCFMGQYRSPETNRCRNLSVLSSTSLTPCKPDQTRNPSTNRCRSTASLSSLALKPCSDGQERNPDTNRCRKVLSQTALPSLDQDDSQSAHHTNVILLISVLALILGYAMYEYRYDVANLYLRIRRRN